MQDNISPVFIRGLSRSGGTLLCTILDAHPDLAISYELYPNLLQLDLPADRATQAVKEFLSDLTKSSSIKGLKQSLYPNPKYRVFSLRLERGGVTKNEFQELLSNAISNDVSFTKYNECAEFVSQCCSLKMNKESKSRWGAKMNNRIAEYLDLWPHAKCIDIVRDGRDVAASQLKLGTFNKSIEQIATSWSKTHAKFSKFEEQYPDNVKTLKYEDLVLDSEKILVDLCEFLELEYSEKMFYYHKENLTLFDANHISKKNVMSGINSDSLGRWKTILTRDQAQEFERFAEPTLKKFSYI